LAETNAETAETNAVAAQLAAESARDSALAAYDNFDDRYLGAKTSDPTLDNDGDALVAGALYFNSVAGEMRLYTGSAWVAAYVSGSGVLVAANNLSDLTNVATARQNLDLEIGVDVQAYDATILKSADIGVTVQGYDADTTKNDVANTFTTNQVISVNSSSDALRITQVGAGNALLVEDSANPDSTPFVVDASGNVISGATATYRIATAADPRILAQGIVPFAGTRNENTANGPVFALGKSRLASDVFAVVLSGDTLGTVGFDGADGTAYVRGASIAAQVDGTPGTDDMPGRLVFSTTADGASSPTERMRIDSSGNVQIRGNSTQAATLQMYEDTDNGTNYVALKAPASVASNVTWTLPNADGTADQVLKTDGSGALGWASIITSGTSVASTSGTSIDFTSIPNWVKRITVMFSEVSTNGTSNYLFQLGDSGGIENTGYLGGGSDGSATNTLYTSGFGLVYASQSVSLHGSLVISLLDLASNKWSASGLFVTSNTTTGTRTTAGSKSLSATLDRVRITTVNGTDTFDAGSINILYE
jgi:hypothetical protein